MISFKNFVQAMQKKDQISVGGGGNNGGECSTLQSDATHLTILPDSQLVAYPESEDDNTSQTEVITHNNHQ